MLNLFTSSKLGLFCTARSGETRLGQSVSLPAPTADLPQQLSLAAAEGCRYVLLGVPEDIGPRANLGLAGADKGWQAFLTKFLNLQANDFIPAKQILLLGHIECTDLQQQADVTDDSQSASPEQLRQLVSELDERVATVVQAIFAAGLYPLIIG